MQKFKGLLLECNETCRFYYTLDYIFSIVVIFLVECFFELYISTNCGSGNGLPKTRPHCFEITWYLDQKI